MNYEKIKKEYQKGTKVKDIKEQYNLSQYDWKRIIKQFREEGIKIRGYKQKQNNKPKNITGIKNVSIRKDSNIKQGFMWDYTYKENNKKIKIQRIDLTDLEQEVTNRNLEWKIIDQYLADESYLFNQDNMEIHYTSGKDNRGRRNTTGIIGVFIARRKNGISWIYHYKDNTGKLKQIRNMDLNVLKDTVLNKGLDWIVSDEALASKSFFINGDNLKSVDKNTGKSFGGNKTGLYRVSKSKLGDGFIWNYQYNVDGKHCKIARMNLVDLKEEVLNRGLKWEVLDEELARKSFRE